MAELLDTEDADELFVSGCAENMRAFLPRFDHIVLLTVAESTIVERLGLRSPGSYGTLPEQVARVLALVRTIEPRLRRIATHVIDTGRPIDQVVADVRRVADIERRGSVE